MKIWGLFIKGPMVEPLPTNECFKAYT